MPFPTQLHSSLPSSQRPSIAGNLRIQKQLRIARDMKARQEKKAKDAEAIRNRIPVPEDTRGMNIPLAPLKPKRVVDPRVLHIGSTMAHLETLGQPILKAEPKAPSAQDFFGITELPRDIDPQQFHGSAGSKKRKHKEVSKENAAKKAKTTSFETPSARSESSTPFREVREATPFREAPAKVIFWNRPAPFLPTPTTNVSSPRLPPSQVTRITEADSSQPTPLKSTPDSEPNSSQHTPTPAAPKTANWTPDEFAPRCSIEAKFGRSSPPGSTLAPHPVRDRAWARKQGGQIWESWKRNNRRRESEESEARAREQAIQNAQEVRQMQSEESAHRSAADFQLRKERGNLEARLIPDDEENREMQAERDGQQILEREVVQQIQTDEKARQLQSHNDAHGNATEVEQSHQESETIDSLPIAWHEDSAPTLDSTSEPSSQASIEGKAQSPSETQIAIFKGFFTIALQLIPQSTTAAEAELVVDRAITFVLNPEATVNPLSHLEVRLSRRLLDIAACDDDLEADSANTARPVNFYSDQFQYFGLPIHPDPIAMFETRKGLRESLASLTPAEIDILHNPDKPRKIVKVLVSEFKRAFDSAVHDGLPPNMRWNAAEDQMAVFSCDALGYHNNRFKEKEYDRIRAKLKVKLQKLHKSVDKKAKQGRLRHRGPHFHTSNQYYGDWIDRVSGTVLNFLAAMREKPGNVWCPPLDLRSAAYHAVLRM